MLLLIDNHSAHECAAQELAQEPLLSHVRILFLPANSTSKFQRLDQGVIAAFKAGYRRYLLRYLVDKALDEIAAYVSLLQATQWALAAWSSSELSGLVIGACWRRSTVFGYAEGPLPAPPNYNEHEELAKRLQQAGAIREAMAIEMFINPEDEEVEDIRDNDPLEWIAQQYETTDEPDEPIELPIVPLQAAIDALDRLRLYEQQQEDANNDLINLLTRHERVLRSRRLLHTHQVSLTSYFSARAS